MRAHASAAEQTLQDALVNVRAAVQKMEAELALAEAALFKCVLLCAAAALGGN